jgi:hypothetical protein
VQTVESKTKQKTKEYKMKKTIPVSQIASMIYKTRKQAALNSSSSFDSKEEWKKAMKQAWATAHSTKESRRKTMKEAWNKQEGKRIKIKAASARTKAHMDKIEISEEGKERADAEAIYADYEKKWKSKITKRLQ